jgi:hypothetical protein
MVKLILPATTGISSLSAATKHSRWNTTAFEKLPQKKKKKKKNTPKAPQNTPSKETEKAKYPSKVGKKTGAKETNRSTIRLGVLNALNKQ